MILANEYKLSYTGSEVEEKLGLIPSLGLVGAEVGQIAKITAVDDNGVPTAWEPVTVGDTYELLGDYNAADMTFPAYLTLDPDAYDEFRLEFNTIVAEADTTITINVRMSTGVSTDTGYGTYFTQKQSIGTHGWGRRAVFTLKAVTVANYEPANVRLPARELRATYVDGGVTVWGNQQASASVVWQSKYYQYMMFQLLHDDGVGFTGGDIKLYGRKRQ